MKRFTLAAFASGAFFGLGLAMSGMIDARRVRGFPDVFGALDPTLLFVLGGALLTTLLLFPLVLGRGHPQLADTFHLPTRQRVDRRLLGGALIFGVGWGLAGYCPGPAIAGLGAGSSEALWFVPAMAAGMLVHRALSRE